MFATTNAVVNQAFASSRQTKLCRANSVSHRPSLWDIQHAHPQAASRFGEASSSSPTPSQNLSQALLNPAANVTITLGAGKDKVLSPRELQYLAEIADEDEFERTASLSNRPSFHFQNADGEEFQEERLHVNNDRYNSPRRQHSEGGFNLDDKCVTHDDEQRYILRINVGGQSFTLLNRYIQRYGPNTLLGRLVTYSHRQRLRLCHVFMEATNEYFFHRNPIMFQSIYEFYVTGVVHVPEGVCLKKYLAEMHFWGVPYDKISQCCSPVSDMEGENDDKESETNDEEQMSELFAGKCCASARLRIWRVTEGMDNGKAWKIYEFLSTGFVLASILGLIIGSLPMLQVNRSVIIFLVAYAVSLFNFAILFFIWFSKNATLTNSTNEEAGEKVGGLDMQTEHWFFTYVEYVCVAYFAADYCFRLLISPDRRAFIVAPLNAIDLLVIAPCVLELIFELYDLNSEHFRQVRWTIVTVRVLRVLRVLRIAKLGRFSVGLRNFALTMKRSKSHLEMVAVIMITAIIFFSTLEYFLEKDEPNTEFTSIPAAFWWCIVTMSTVGYGDAVPVTAGGKLVASATIVCGMMVLAIPITITVNNFMQVSRMNHASLYTLAHENPSTSANTSATATHNNLSTQASAKDKLSTNVNAPGATAKPNGNLV